jgi:hypothetical protein
VLFTQLNLEQVLFTQVNLESVVFIQRNLEAALHIHQLKSLHMVLLARLSSVAVVLCLRNLVMKYYRMLGNALVSL